MKIITIIGARPQFIKAAVLSRLFRSEGKIEEMIIHTGQHFDENMSDVFFREMGIPEPTYNLQIHGLSHGEMTGQMLTGIEKILIKEKPDFVLVYGDTNSTIAGALAAKKLHIKVAHVEAGLRSYNMRMPEEINRIITDRLSDIAFCPTEQAVENLRNEGFDHFPTKVIRTGDIMYDAALHYSEKARKQSTIIADQHLTSGSYVLATIHRAENTDDLNRLKEIVDGLNTIAAKMPVIVPLHPRTKIILARNGLVIRFKIIDPVGYMDMINLTQHACLVITDSGGLQKEACFFQKYCITTRDETEWVELVNKQVNRVVGANSRKIEQAFIELQSKPFPANLKLYGTGETAQAIYEALINYTQA